MSELTKEALTEFFDTRYVKKDDCDSTTHDIEKKLSNEKFVSKAPADVVAQERAKLAEAQEKLARVREQMKAY